MTETVSPTETDSGGCWTQLPKFWPSGSPSEEGGETRVINWEEKSGGVGPASKVSPWLKTVIFVPQI